MRVSLASLCFSLFCTASSTVPCGVSLGCLSVPPSAVTGITVCSSLPFPCPAARGAFCSAVGFAVGCFVLEDLGFILFSLSHVQLFPYICNRGHKINKRYLQLRQKAESFSVSVEEEGTSASLILLSNPAISRERNKFLCTLPGSFAFHIRRYSLPFNESHLSLVMPCWNNNFLSGK